MNRLLWGIALLAVVAAGGWAQSTWRGQAEVWTTGAVPTDGFVAASNEFPRNSLLSIENYKTHKTVQVRVVAALPAGSSAWVLLNPKAAAALDMKAGDAPLVGVRLDPSGIDLAENPDPDVNPLALKPLATPLATPAPAVAMATSPVPVVPAPGVAPSAPLPVPALAPDSAPAAGSATDEATRTPLAVADEPEPSAPVTPGKQVFLTTSEPEPVATETPSVTENNPVVPAPEVAAIPAPSAVPAPAAEPAPVAEAPGPSPEPVSTPEPVPSPPAVAVIPPAEAPPPVPAPVPAVAVGPLAVKPAPATAWVPVPAKLEGQVLGQVPVLAGLEKGRPYVQVGAWATEADVLKVMGSVKSYVPLALYKADGEKNPWRLVVASAPKGQLGVLLMLFRSEGYRTATVVKG